MPDMLLVIQKMKSHYLPSHYVLPGGTDANDTALFVLPWSWCYQRTPRSITKTGTIQTAIFDLFRIFPTSLLDKQAELCGAKVKGANKMICPHASISRRNRHGKWKYRRRYLQDTSGWIFNGQCICTFIPLLLSLTQFTSGKGSHQGDHSRHHNSQNPL